MKRQAKFVLTIVALALVAAAPPTAPGLATRDDRADIAALKKIREVYLEFSPDDATVTFIKFRGGSQLDMRKVVPLVARLHDVRFLERVGSTDELLKCATNWPSLEMLDLSISRNVTENGLRHLGALDHLTHLKLRATSIGDSGIEYVAGLKTLVELDLGQTKVTDVGVRRLRGLTALERLDLGHTHISDKGLESVGALETLTMLDLSSTPISDAGIGSLSHLRNLRVLVLWDTDVTDAGVAKLKPLHNLQRLELGGALATEDARKHFDLSTGLQIYGLRTKADLLNLDNPADVAALRAAGLRVDTNNLRNVTQVETNWWDGSPRDWLPKLANLHSLTILRLPRGTTDADLARVCQLKSLKTLEIYQGGITDAGTKDIGRLTELEELSLSGCRSLGDVTAARLSSLGKLEILDLSYSALTNKGLKELAGLRTLKKLNISDTKITDAGLAPLENLGSLLQLDLSRTLVSDAGLLELARLKDLDYLTVHQTAITRGGVDRVKKLKPKLTVWPDPKN